MNFIDNLSANDIANFRIFAWWAAIMVLKIYLMVPLTVRWRFTKKIFISTEDRILLKDSKVTYDDPDIERVRRAHLNDLENILPWAISTALWLTTSPDPTTAAFFIKSFGIVRIIHTIVYAVIVIPQPTRAIAFFIGYFITLYQSIATLYYYM